MTRRIEVAAAADLDLDEQFDYIARDNVDAALRFFQAARDTFQQLAALPRIGARREVDNPALANLRWFRVRDFSQYLIFYRETPDGIEIVRVLHGARDIDAILQEE